MTEPSNNAETLSITLKCPACKKTSPSPIFITPYGSFKTAWLSGNKMQCPHCGVMFPCNTENFVAKFSDGGFVGNAVVD